MWLFCSGRPACAPAERGARLFLALSLPVSDDLY
jgi:hypothetical protein